MKGKIYKPSLLISNSVPLTASQMNVYNYMLKKAFEQLQKNYLTDIFEYSVAEFSKHFSYLDSIKRVDAFFNELFDKEFNFNLLNKDKTIKSHIKSRFISSIENIGDGRFKVSLEPNSVKAMRIMVAKDQGIDLPLPEKFNSYAHIDLEINNSLTFYPSKVVYEILKDYNGVNIPSIDTKIFQEATNTVDKFKSNYKTNVLNRIERDMASKGIHVEINFKKQGRRNRWVEIKRKNKTEVIENKTETRKDIIERALKTFEVKYIKDLDQKQKELLNKTLEIKRLKKVK